MQDVIEVQCPWCLELVELVVDPQTEGGYVEDCAVCCRPWQVVVARDADGTAHVDVERE